MNKHIAYLKYLARHKWFVLGAALGLCLEIRSVWTALHLIFRAIIHDWSKFLPSEWFPYVEAFYGRGNVLRKERKERCLTFLEQKELEAINAAFDKAWLLHQHRNRHHWQYWVLREDSGAMSAIEMPEVYRFEMLADWYGAGRAITGNTGTTAKWYANNRKNMYLDKTTARRVDAHFDFPGYAPL